MWLDEGRLGGLELAGINYHELIKERKNVPLVGQQLLHRLQRQQTGSVMAVARVAEVVRPQVGSQEETAKNREFCVLYIYTKRKLIHEMSSHDKFK